MIKIDFNEPVNDPNWDNWRTKCKEGTDKIISQYNLGEKLKIKSSLYRSDLVKKKYYLSDSSEPPFFRKCAYCEISLHFQDGDIEHYRPKKAVYDKAGNKIDHPGYYWLAYDWQNLFPSCTRCNRKYKWDTTQNSYVTGKGNIFPVYIEADRMKSPHDQIANEKPLILNPLIDNPDDHLDFETATGKLISKTERGLETINVLGLNSREQLVIRRIETAELTTKSFNDFNTALVQEDHLSLKKHALVLLSGLEGSKEFSFVRRKTIIKLHNDCENHILSSLESRNLI